MNHPASREACLLKGYKVGALIGKGSFSNVYKATSEQPGRDAEFAIKLVIAYKPKDKLRTTHEVAVLKKLQHPNVVIYTENFSVGNLTFIVTEFCKYGDLDSFTIARKKCVESLVKMMMDNMSAALVYMYGKKICHMDVKPKNILISKLDPPQFKITDFGVAEILTPANCHKFINNGTLVYMAPEKLLHMPFDIRSDIWSLGVTMFHCLFGRPQYFNKPHSTIKQLAINNELIDIPRTAHVQISDKCMDLLMKLLIYNPNDRITHIELIAHPFIAQPLNAAAANEEICRIAESAIYLDNAGKYIEAIAKYDKAIHLIGSYIEHECNNVKRAAAVGQVDLYLTRKEIIISALQKRKTPTHTESILKRRPDLIRLVAATPRLQNGFLIGFAGEDYFSDNRLKVSLEHLTDAIDIILPLSISEPEGIRKDVILQQVEKWITLAEDIKRSITKEASIRKN